VKSSKQKGGAEAPPGEDNGVLVVAGEDGDVVHVLVFVLEADHGAGSGVWGSGADGERVHLHIDDIPAGERKGAEDGAVGRVELVTLVPGAGAVLVAVAVGAGGICHVCGVAVTELAVGAGEEPDLGVTLAEVVGVDVLLEALFTGETGLAARGAEYEAAVVVRGGVVVVDGVGCGDDVGKGVDLGGVALGGVIALVGQNGVVPGNGCGVGEGGCGDVAHFAPGAARGFAEVDPVAVNVLNGGPGKNDAVPGAGRADGKVLNDGKVALRVCGVVPGAARHNDHAKHQCGYK